jgi:peptide subunit release factor 1 (eRF1)
LYRCDSEFHTRILYGLYDAGDQYLILLVKGQETIYMEYERQLGARQLRQLGKYATRIARNHDRGGQSQNRIERLRQIQIHEYLKAVNERALGYALDPENLTKTKYKGMILAGSGQKKDDLLKGPLDDRLRAIYLGTITYDSELDLTAIDDIVDGVDRVEQRDRWLIVEDLIRTDPDRLTFGKDECLIALDNGLIKELYISATTDPLRERCQTVGCTIIAVGSNIGSYMMCGIKWY